MSKSRPFRLTVLILSILAALASTAGSALAADTIASNGSTVTYSDEGTESSTLTVALGPDTITITQADGDPIDGDGMNGCPDAPAVTVTCTSVNMSDFQLLMGQGDDNVTVDGNYVTGPFDFEFGTVYGGDGVDTLTGSDSNGYFERLYGENGKDTLNSRNIGPQPNFPFRWGDTASGGEGDDVITTGNGADFASGDDGTDLISTGAGNDGVSPGQGDGDRVDLGDGNDELFEDGGNGTGDVFDGGPGFDRLNVESEEFNPPDVFNIDLAAGTFDRPSAPPPETDSVPNFEDVITGTGADTVNGTDGPNVIDTNLGEDIFGGDGVLAPPDGPDLVNPRGGPDFVATGHGDDQIEARDGAQDTIRCGPGNDTAQVDQFDVLNGCENAPVTPTRPAGTDTNPPDCQLAGVKGRYARMAFTKGFTALVTCDEAATLLLRIVATLKSGKDLTARAGDLVLAEKTVSAAANQAQGTKLKPSKKLLKRFRKGRGLRVRVVVEARDEFGNSDLVNKRVKVKKAKKAKRKRR